MADERPEPARPETGQAFETAAKERALKPLSETEGLAEADRIAAVSPEAARCFIETAPLFMARDSHLHLREWGGMVREILVIDPTATETAIAFMHSSIALLEAISYRIHSGWLTAGIRLMRTSAATANAFFSSIPDGLLSLYQTEMRKIFELTAASAKDEPSAALSFYQSAAGRLLGLNPNVREKVLDATRRIAAKTPEALQAVFEQIAAGIEGLSYPDQEMVTHWESDISRRSSSAARVYFDHAASIIHSVRTPFFKTWVAEGCRKLEVSEQAGIETFSLRTAESQQALARWQQAVFLNDVERPLSIFARALCGRAIHLKGFTEETSERPELFGQTPDEGGDNLFLPPYMATETAAEENLRIYRVAVAHQAGYIEFGTFGPDYPKIAETFNTFPQPELIRDIFFVLENGRIDFCLRNGYRGLRRDLDRVLASRMQQRPLPKDSLLHEALEVLLRFVYGSLQADLVPPVLRPYLNRFESILSGLYTVRTKPTAIFVKAVEIYDALKPLFPGKGYAPFDSFDYLEMPALEMSSAGDGDEVGDTLKSGDSPNGGGLELSEEEMATLAELLKDIATLEPLEKGKGGSGIVIEGLSAEVSGELDELSDDDPRPDEKTAVSGRLPQLAARRGPFYYDEWDYLQQDYRAKWCCLREISVNPAESDLFEKIYSEYSDLIRDVKRQFQRIRPEELEKQKRLEWGSEIDFNAMIQNVVDRKTGDTPSDRIFSRREKKRRRISTFLLIDMSASTDRMAASLTPEAETGQRAPEQGQKSERLDLKGKRIIDIEIESLVVMAEALEALDDRYAIFGFSGYGRDQVEMFAVKDFSDPYNRETKNRICGIQPRKSTRMGPAIRHAANRLKETDSDHQLLIMLSDGYPQDMNYGEDRTSQTYALNDTMMALIEAKRAGIRPFCITIDQCGDDYLRKMIDPGSYLVIQDIHSLPTVLPRVVESLMG